MIIYNNNKQFIGVDEDNLKSLGYSNLAGLMSEAADFADLLVKVPGHVHNFKHVHWIDFILCATDKNSSKAIIHANGKSFSCVLDIKTIYLTSAPTKQSYGINLNNLRALSAEEVQNISGDLQARPAPVAAAAIPEPVAETITEDEEPEILTPTEASQTPEPEVDDAISLDEFDMPDDTDSLPAVETGHVELDPYEIDDEFNLDVFEPSEDDLSKIGDADSDSDTTEAPMTRDDLHENLHEHIALDDEPEEIQEEPKEEVYVTSAEAEISDDDNEDYVFDIQETADALEMDVATIQDFVNDFIDQAKDFKPKLYEAVENDDMVELKSLSHQLKGVAANLRIHDAQDILIKINKADDFTYSLQDLDKFYRIMAKLSGEEPEQPTPPATPTKTVDEPAIEEKPHDIAVEDSIDDDAVNIDTEEEPLELAEDSNEDDALEIPSIEEEPLELAEDSNEDDALEIPSIEEDPLELAEDSSEDDALEIPSIEEEPLELAEDSSEDDALEIPSIEEDTLELAEDSNEDDALEIPSIEEDPLELAEDSSEDDALEIPSIEEDPFDITEDTTKDDTSINSEDSFDMLDEEQESLISSKETEDILDEIEEVKPTPSYDKMSIANEIGLDEETFNELFEDFSNESKDLIVEAQEAIDANDSKKWQHAAVKLKGMSDNMRIEAFKPELEALINIQDSSDAQITLNSINTSLLSILDTKD